MVPAWISDLGKRLVLGLIEISDPDEIILFETSGAVDRVHAIPTSEVPLWVRTFFRGTRFYDEERDEWFVPFEPTGAASKARRDYVSSRLYDDAGRPRFTPGDVARVVRLLKDGATDRMLGEAMADIIGRMFTGQAAVPFAVSDASQDLLRVVPDMVNPCKYAAALKGAGRLVAYTSHFASPSGVACPVDMSHNISAANIAVVLALRSLQQNPDKSITEILSNAPPTPNLLRIAVANATVGKHRLRRGKTVVQYSLVKAAPKASDARLLFTFAVGVDQRVCACREFILAFLAAVRVGLDGGTPASGANGA